MDFFYVFIQENAFENVVLKIAAILSRPQCVEADATMTVLPVTSCGQSQPVHSNNAISLATITTIK